MRIQLIQRNTRLIDLLHEEVHAAQLLAIRESRLDRWTHIQSDLEALNLHIDLRNRLEKDAYEYELYLARYYGFSPEYVADLQRSLDTYWGAAQQASYNSALAQSELLRAIDDVLKGI